MKINNKVFAERNLNMETSLSQMEVDKEDNF